MDMETDVLIIGAGLSGLACAKRVAEAGIDFQIVEASDRVGGRANTDEIDGFLLDRGFQVFLTAYPEAKRVFDYEALELSHFEPGALIRYRGQFHRFVDPWRRPSHLPGTVVSPVATLMDKIRVALLRLKVTRGSLEQLYERPELKTGDYLQQCGFSDRIIETFFRPFLSGIFLEKELATSSRMFEFVFRMFSQGHAALPRRGMRALGEQLASRIPENRLHLETAVSSLSSEGRVELGDGRLVKANQIVIASDPATAVRWLNGESSFVSFNATTCYYFVADRPPIDEPILVLNGDGSGPVNSLCVPNLVQPGYAPDGKFLVSVSVVGASDSRDQKDNEAEVRDQLSDWFGDEANSWTLLKRYSIPHALPQQSPPALSPVAKSARAADFLICGDSRDTASIQGALISGRRAAEKAIETEED